MRHYSRLSSSLVPRIGIERTRRPGSFERIRNHPRVPALRSSHALRRNATDQLLSTAPPSPAAWNGWSADAAATVSSKTRRTGCPTRASGRSRRTATSGSTTRRTASGRNTRRTGARTRASRVGGSTSRCARSRSTARTTPPCACTRAARATGRTAASRSASRARRREVWLWSCFRSLHRN